VGFSLIRGLTHLIARHRPARWFSKRHSLEGDVGHAVGDVPARIRIGLAGDRVALDREVVEVDTVDGAGRPRPPVQDDGPF